MTTRLYFILISFFISANCIGQTKITDITNDQNHFRVIFKQVDSTEFLLAISPDDFLNVYEINNDELTLKDKRYYPDLFINIIYITSEHFFLTSNEEGSIAYDLRDYTEFIIPYDETNYKTQWQVKNHDVVTLLQSGTDYRKIFADLNTKEYKVRLKSETILNLTDKYERLRREYENDEDEEHIITNLTTNDSIVINTGMLYGGHSDFNDNYFVYKKEDQILKIDNSNFTNSQILTIPDDEKFEKLVLVEHFTLVYTQLETIDNRLIILDENDQIIFDKIVDFRFDKIYHKTIDNKILLSGVFNKFTTIDLATGMITEGPFNYNRELQNLNSKFLITYDDHYIYLISNDDLSIISKNIPEPLGQITNITSSGLEGKYHYSLDVYLNQTGKTLFEIIDTDISIYNMLENQTSGISNPVHIHTNNNLEKLVLFESGIYSFDEFGYTLLSANPLSELFVTNPLKIDTEQVCWSENNENNEYQIQCFKGDELIDHGSIPNLEVNPSIISLLNFTVEDDNILYFRLNGTSPQKQLRIKKSSGLDSLIMNITSSISYKEIQNKPFFSFDQSLHTYDFQNDTVHNLNIPIDLFFSSSDLISHNDKVFILSNNAVYEINGLSSQKLFETNSTNLHNIQSVGDYIFLSTTEGYTILHDASSTDLNLEQYENISYLGGNHISISGYEFGSPISPKIYNVVTNETYQLDDDFINTSVVNVIPTDNHNIVISQKIIDGLVYYSVDKFDITFSEYSNVLNILKSTNTFGGNQVLREANDYTVSILDQTILYIDNNTGEIFDNISVLGLVNQYQTTLKNDILYFIKYEEGTGRQIYKYNPTVLNNTDLHTQKFNIYPNPSNNYLTIKSPNIFQQWNLLSNTGNQIMGSTSDKNEVNIDLSNLDSGLYFIEIFVDGVKSTQKLLKF